MAELAVELPTAVQWVSDLHDEIVDKFFKARDELLAHKDGAPLWSPEMDGAVRSYIDGMGASFLSLFTCSSANARTP